MWGARSIILALVLLAPCSARLGNTAITATVNSTGVLEWERCHKRFNATITKYQLSVSRGTVDKACRAIATRTASSSHGRLLQEDTSMWTDIGDKLGDLDFESIKWGAEDPKTGERNDLSTYGTLMTGTMYTVGALEAGIDGDWDSLWQGLGQSAVLFTSLIPGVGPFLSVGLSFFMSFFGGQDNIMDEISDMLQDSLEKLYSQIMTEVKTMINDARVADAITNAQIMAKNCADRVYDVPTVMELFSLRDDKYDQLDDMWEWWDVTENNFANSWRYVFGGEVNCLDQGDELVSPKDGNCIAFLEKGAFIYQVNFAITHLNVVIEMARLSVEMAGPDDKDATTQLVLLKIRSKADKYYKLLKDSLDTWKEGVQKYQYAIGCQASLDLSLFTSSASEIVSETFAYVIKKTSRGWSVQTTRTLPYHPSTTFDLSCEMGCGNTSLTSDRVPEPCGNPINGVCSDADFAKFTQAYLDSVKALASVTYEPLLESMKALASPLDMGSKVNEILELGKQGIQNDIDSTSPDEARRSTLYNACLEKAPEASGFADICESIKTQDAASIPVSRCACRSAYCAAESSQTYSSLCMSMCDVLPGIFGQ